MDEEPNIYDPEDREGFVYDPEVASRRFWENESLD